MKIYAIPFLLISLQTCDFSSHHTDKSHLVEYQEIHAAYDSAQYTFPNGTEYYRLKNFDLSSLTDTFLRVHDVIFEDEKVRQIVNKNIANWLQDSIFIGTSQTRKGSHVVDTTNLLFVDDPFEYGLKTSSFQRQPLNGQLLELRYNWHTVTIDDKDIYYYMYPMDGRLLDELAKYYIETTEDYKPSYMQNSRNQSSLAQLQYYCDKYIADWYIAIHSDHFFDDQLAFKITDTTYHYTSEIRERR
ncbi:MAG: hypothetical protein AAFQ83_20480 [Bacteroidota bacterium]